MSSIKKKLSVSAGKAIEEVLNNNKGKFLIQESEGCIFRIVDIHNSSDFFFEITKETLETTGHFIHYKAKPYSASSANAAQDYDIPDTFKKALTFWFENILYYQEDSILDDPIILGYEKEFYQEYKITDEDADSMPFDYEQQILLDKYLGTIIKELDTLKTKKNESFINELKEEATELKENITCESKNGFMKKLSHLWAKGRKGGISVSNFMLKEFAKEFLKEGVKATFNFALKNANKLPEYIHNFINETPNLLN